MKIHKVITLDELEEHNYNLERNLFYEFKNVLLVPKKKNEVIEVLRNSSYSKLIQVGTILDKLFDKTDMVIENQKKITLENIFTLPVTFKNVNEIVIKKNTQSLGNRTAYEFIGNIKDIYIENFNSKSPYDHRKTDLLFGDTNKPIKNMNLVFYSGDVGSIYFNSKDSQFGRVLLHETFHFKNLSLLCGFQVNAFSIYKK